MRRENFTDQSLIEHVAALNVRTVRDWITKDRSSYVNAVCRGLKDQIKREYGIKGSRGGNRHPIKLWTILPTLTREQNVARIVQYVKQQCFTSLSDWRKHGEGSYRNAMYLNAIGLVEEKCKLKRYKAWGKQNERRRCKQICK